MKNIVTDYKIVALKDTTEFNEVAVDWFHEKWNVPKEAYLESILECQKNNSKIPQWYLVLNSKQQIIGGVGLIANDFHKRKELTPNLCALFVEEEFRNAGIAGNLLNFVCAETAKAGFSKLYLITSHEYFYEKYGWNFKCMVEEDNGNEIRMYQRELSSF